MCELFGVSSPKPIRVDPFLKTLMSHSIDHPHGWGMAVFHGTNVSLEKEPKPGWVSDYASARLAHPFSAANMIAHIRLATRGSMDYENCHPFLDWDASGRAWTLAHNGTIFESALLDAYRGVQEGATDSERILCHILKKMNDLLETASGPVDAARRFALMDSIILEIAEHNKVNLLFYDGEQLYVHTNMRGTLYRSFREGGVLFATVPLDGGKWEPVPMMQLLAYREGKQTFAGTPHSYEYVKPDPATETRQWSGL